MYKTQEKKIVYYPGCFANFWDPQIGKAMVRILEKNGFRITLLKHRCCGMGRFGYGDIKGARKMADNLVNEIFPLVEQGYDIITACPSCSLALKDEYPFLLNNEKAKLIAEKTFFWSRFLNKLHEMGGLKNHFERSSLSIAYHSPCHLKSQGLNVDSLKMMTLIPSLRVIDLDRGCCGMGGTLGFKQRYFKSSMKIGNALFERIKEINPDVVATDCSACELQIEQNANVKVVHPLLVLTN